MPRVRNAWVRKGKGTKCLEAPKTGRENLLNHKSGRIQGDSMGSDEPPHSETKMF